MTNRVAGGSSGGSAARCGGLALTPTVQMGGALLANRRRSAVLWVKNVRRSFSSRGCDGILDRIVVRKTVEDVEIILITWT